MYQKKIVHRDLKPENILISFPNRTHNLSKAEILNIDLLHEDFIIKICDFGYNRELKKCEQDSKVFATTMFMAPEVLY